MSVRAQVIIKDSDEELWFYRHSDGYPDGVKASLDKFCGWIREGRIRNNASQAAGWLVMIGAAECRGVYSLPGSLDKTDAELLEPCDRDVVTSWKVGTYEPCGPELHGDVKHLYVVNAENATWEETSLKGWQIRVGTDSTSPGIDSFAGA
jgi:hypothetical protein